MVRRHPWLFSGAVASVTGDPAPGETVEISDAEGLWVARGAYSPTSQIRARVWTFDDAEEVDAEFFSKRIAAATEARSGLAASGVSAYRLIYSESDGLPGLIVDRYGDHLVCQLLSAGAERWRNEIVRALETRASPAGIFERSDTGSRRLEGLEPRTGVLSGEPPPDLVSIQDGECRFLVDVREGHKTGFYLDQREHRALVATHASGADVLNCFSYTGGFGVAAGHGGARSITNVESSASANELARRNAELNGIPSDRFTIEEQDVFLALRAYRDRGISFDLVVLDPPKFAESQAQVERAARGYKDLNLLAFKLLRPGGLLFTFSCSGHMKADLFQKVVADAALDARRDGTIVARLDQPPDHPTALSFPESSYLKGLMVRVS